MKRIVCLLITISITGYLHASEVPLCSLPNVGSKISLDNAKIEGDADPGCELILKDAKTLAQKSLPPINFFNTTSIPSQLSVGAVYLQPITMMPAAMMRPRDQSDIHLELDIHAKKNLKSRGFAPGDWLPNVRVTYSIQKIGDSHLMVCGIDPITKQAKTTCNFMAMAASDGAHYGDNIKLAGPGFYLVTFNAKTDPMKFGWHTDTESKLLGTEYVDWQFKQTYLLKWTGVGKKGGY